MWLLYEYPTLLLAMPALIKKWSVMTAGHKVQSRSTARVFRRSSQKSERNALRLIRTDID